MIVSGNAVAAAALFNFWLNRAGRATFILYCQPFYKRNFPEAGADWGGGGEFEGFAAPPPLPSLE